MSIILGSALAIGSALVSAASNKSSQDTQNKYNAEQTAKQAQSNYYYGEKAADNAHQRSLALMDAAIEKNSLKNQVQQAKDAGMSPGLLYAGGAGAGMSGQGGGAMGSGSSGMAAPHGVPRQSLLEVQQLAMEQKRLENETKLAQAQTQNIEADTEKKKEETNATVELTPVQKELAKQNAIEKYIENMRKEWENSERANGDVMIAKNKTTGHVTAISKESLYDKKMTTEIAETIARTENNKALAELNTEKKLGYWQELMNATKNADSAAQQAAAIKLAAEWNTGEYTNWKTWVDTAKDAVKVVDGLISTAVKFPIK